jgi:hypothetical protein
LLWYVDVEARTVTVSQLAQGTWVEIAVHGEDERARLRPFVDVEIDFALWWSGPRRQSRGSCALPPTIAALVAIFIPILRDGLSEAWASALWGLLLLFAFVGWGRLVNRWHRPLAPRDWGLDGTVGMACFLWAGAVLAGLRLVRYTYPIWRAREAMVVPEGKRGAMYKMQARYALDTFDNFMALTLSRKVLGHEGDYWVLDLESRP